MRTRHAAYNGDNEHVCYTRNAESGKTPTKDTRSLLSSPLEKIKSGIYVFLDLFATKIMLCASVHVHFVHAGFDDIIRNKFNYVFEWKVTSVHTLIYTLNG